MLTPLAVAVLALLRERPMHPYEMHQLMRERHLDEVIKVKAGSLYHTVDRLDRDGLVAQVGTDREGNRPERTTYQVTEDGHAAVDRWVRERLSHPVQEHPVYPYALTEAHNLTADDAVAALRTRCSELSDEVTRVETLLAAKAVKAEVYRIGAHHRLAMLRAELDLTRDLVARIERKDFPWDPWT